MPFLPLSLSVAFRSPWYADALLRRGAYHNRTVMLFSRYFALRMTIVAKKRGLSRISKR